MERLNNSFSLRTSNMTLRNEYLFYAISVCVNFDYENKFVFENKHVESHTHINFYIKIFRNKRNETNMFN